MKDERIDPRARLGAVVAAFPGQRFAVIDGGHFGDLPAQLKRQRLFARSLFLDQVDEEIQKAGPWLVALDQAAEATDLVFAILGDEKPAVFWCCDAGEATLYRHLRTLNMARIPKWALNGDDKLRAETGENPSVVFFRHFSPEVLGDLLPCMDVSQAARFLGPAQEVAFVSDDYGLRRLTADGHPFVPGMLTIRSEQIIKMTNRQVAALNHRTLNYLREVGPEVTDDIPDEHLLPFVENCHDDGKRLGLTTQHAHFQWAYLNVMSRGRISNFRKATDFITAGPESPNDRIQILVEKIIGDLRVTGTTR